MFYSNLAIDQKAPRLRCQHVAVLLVVFLIAILSVGCSKQPSTTGDDAQTLEQIDAQLMASGQWRDPDTSLIWMRCSIGQTWTGKTCTGNLLSLNWQDAQDYVAQFTNADGGFAGHSDWRVPSIDELVTLRRCSTGWERRIESRLTPEGRRDVAVGPETMTLPSGSSVPVMCTEDSLSPSIDTSIFPNTTLADFFSLYWSASSDADKFSEAWGVGFGFGGVSSDLKNNNGHVRAVRVGQSVSKASTPVEAAATSAEPVASEGYSPRPLATDSQADQSLLTSGQWRDPDTGLIWMRCSIGQTWTGSTCSGTPIKLSWDAANDYFQQFNQQGFAGHQSWRLPKIEEMVSIRRCSNGWAQERVVTLPNGRSVPFDCADGSRRPTIDNTIFPNTPVDIFSLYWSASPDAPNHAVAWYVGFDSGGTDYSKDISYGKSYGGHIRAVRAGQ